MIVNPLDQMDALRTIFPFSMLDDEDLKSICPFFEELTLPAGATVISDGYPAADLFFILSGKVKVVLHQSKTDEVLGIMGSGDHFGEDALVGNQTYQTRAICTTAATVLRIRASKATTIANTFPDLHAAFSLFQKTYQLSCSQPLSWRAADEGVELFSRRHPFFLFLRLFLVGGAFLVAFSFLLFSAMASLNYSVPLLLLSFLVLFVGVIICAWSGLEWGNDFFILTRERVCVQKKLIGFYESRHESPVNAVLSVGVDTSFFGRILGYGTVTVRTYTGDLQFKRLPHPYIIYEFLENRREAAALEATQTEEREIREALTGRVDRRSGHKSIPESDHGSRERISSLSDLMANIFNLRTEQDNSVIYRTHWWILFKKTLLPGFILLLVVLAVIAKFTGFLSSIPELVVYVSALVLALACWGWWMYQFQDWQNDVYIITDDLLIDVYKKPLGMDDRRSAPVKNIQTVEFERKGLINLLLNFGTVKMKIGNEELTFDNVYQPSEVQSEIYKRYRATLETAKKNEQQKFVEWIKTYEEIKKENRRANEDENG
ncbi:MAG: hypothetical protein CVU42_16730 [Chloroflexi bacterium HGW-Chloroflexi-4]|jgi:uncharacterized membrane protein YdbT with pleckstrin-like domain|nr:MAG: hypothetical protein CVU42_16730 [Chloroflexi bacterium HGW-Chloroflexi-4]